MNKEKILKYVGYSVTLVGAGITILQKRCEEQKTRQLIEEKVQKQVDEIVKQETKKRLDEMFK